MEKFEEIEVQRIRVVDEDGTVRMVLTSPPLLDRQEAGLVFYTDEGSECGALSFHGRTGEDGPDAEMKLSFNQFEQDEAISLSFRQRGSERSYGLSMVDRPFIPIDQALKEQAERLFVGRLESGEVCLYVMDSKGRPRIRLGIDAEDVPRMDFLNEAGEVAYSFPPESPSTA
jgi:hypothetical protein